MQPEPSQPNSTQPLAPNPSTQSQQNPLHAAEPTQQPTFQQVPVQPTATPAPIPIQPVTQSAVVATQAAPTNANLNTPNVIVMQWLTYAFWGWTALVLSILTATVLANFISGAETGGFTPYAAAAVLVLLPISFVCDLFYSKHEPEKKTGAAMIVMVIHAVLFALFAVGSLIGIVFSIVQLLTSRSDSSGTLTALYTSIIIAIIYALILIRTINPPKFKWIPKSYRITMVIIVGTISLLGFIGPVAHARQTRTDRLIESEIGSVSSSIDNYANTNKHLPDDLTTITLNGDAKLLVTDNLVEYTPNSLSPSTTSNQYGVNYQTISTTTTYYYTLCTTYKKAKENKYNTYNSSTLDGYTTYVSAYSHPAGHVCYKLKTTTYSYSK